MKYCEYKVVGEKKAIATNVENLNELLRSWKTGLIRKEKDVTHFFEEKTIDKNDTVIVNGKEKAPCDLCDHRLKNLTEGCNYCRFENDDIKKNLNHSLEPIEQFLQSKKAEKVNVKQTVEHPYFETEFFPREIDLSDEMIEKARVAASERAKKAAITRKFRKETCSTCIYALENNHCIFTHPNFCQKNYYADEKMVYEKILPKIKNKEKLLKLSMFCGRTIKYNRVRYRLSYVINEETGEFLATRDYTPWDETIIPYEIVKEKLDGVDDLMSSETIFENISQDEINQSVVILQLLKQNWRNVSRIETWQKQHLFWAGFNPNRKQIDVEIHLSKMTFPYHYKDLKDLFKTTTMIHL